ncbi:MAG TPA: hypothetical protein VHB02_10255 [Acidimicrobiales bacterium]|nr:hypothetical protein [Acidimicrobiales bacterium]
MGDVQRNEVEEAFARYWSVGCVGENWRAWADMFVPDVWYVDYFWGEMHRRDEVIPWIDAVMKGVPEIYTILDWYRIDGDTVTFHCQNRRDNPDDEGPAYWDFPGLSVIRYAGDGQWASEEDYWDVKGARRTSQEYAEACRRAGTPTPEQRMTRRHWPTDGPDWNRTDQPPNPSWVGSEYPPITKPWQFRQLLGREPA